MGNCLPIIPTLHPDLPASLARIQPAHLIGAAERVIRPAQPVQPVRLFQAVLQVGPADQVPHDQVHQRHLRVLFHALDAPFRSRQAGGQQLPSVT